MFIQVVRTLYHFFVEFLEIFKSTGFLGFKAVSMSVENTLLKENVRTFGIFLGVNKMMRWHLKLVIPLLTGSVMSLYLFTVYIF